MFLSGQFSVSLGFFRSLPQIWNLKLAKFIVTEEIRPVPFSYYVLRNTVIFRNYKQGVLNYLFTGFPQRNHVPNELFKYYLRIMTCFDAKVVPITHKDWLRWPIGFMLDNVTAFKQRRLIENKFERFCNRSGVVVKNRNHFDIIRQCFPRSIAPTYPKGVAESLPSVLSAFIYWLARSAAKPTTSLKRIEALARAMSSPSLDHPLPTHFSANSSCVIFSLGSAQFRAGGRGRVHDFCPCSSVWANFPKSPFPVSWTQYISRKRRFASSCPEQEHNRQPGSDEEVIQQN